MKQHSTWYLEGLKLFEKFCPLKLENNGDAHVLRTFKAGDWVFQKDDPAHNLYIIKQGMVRIGYHTSDGEDRTKAVLREGEVFGEMVLAGEEVRHEFAQCGQDDTQLCVLSREAFYQMMREDAELSIKVVRWFGLRMERMERKIDALIFKDARTRIVEFLRDAVAFKGKQVGHEWLLRTRLTHADIARLTATSRQTVNEVFNELRRANLIHFERGKIIVREIEKLK